MTIALIVDTKPSRYLLAACISMLTLVHGCVFLSIDKLVFPAYLKVSLLIISCSASIYLTHRYWQRTQQSKQISISATGEIVLRATSEPAGSVHGINVHLSHRSRIWPYFLSVFLQDELGQEYKLLILQDSLSPAAFRALRVSLMWIAQHQVR